MINDITQRQIELERDMMQQGITRYRNMKTKAIESGNETAPLPVQRLLKSSIEPVADGIAEFIESSAKRRGRKHVAFALVKDSEPAALALIGCRIILDRLTLGGPGESQLAISIGMAIEDEARFVKFETEAPGYFNTLQRNVTEHIYG